MPGGRDINISIGLEKDARAFEENMDRSLGPQGKSRSRQRHLLFQ
jgi:hypothetical protein